MPTAICNKCYKTFYWRNTRGSGISGQACTCGGQFVAAMFDESAQKYVPRGDQSKNTGRKFEPCAICGKRRTIPGGGQRVEQDDLWPIVIGTFSTGWKPYYLRVSAGSMICWSHDKTLPACLSPNHIFPDGALLPRDEVNS